MPQHNAVLESVTYTERVLCKMSRKLLAFLFCLQSKGIYQRSTILHFSVFLHKLCKYFLNKTLKINVSPIWYYAKRSSQIDNFTIKILFTIPTFPAYLLSILYFVKIAVSEAEAKACA